MIKLPFIFRFVPKDVILKHTEKHLNVGRTLKPLLIKLKTDLFQADIDIKPEGYINLCFFSSIWIFSILFAISTVIFLLGFISPIRDFIPALFTVQTFTMNSIIFAFVAATVFAYTVNYPKLSALKRVRELEMPLLTAFRNVLIKIRSGVSLFNALVSLSEGYGELSKEIKIAISKANAGVPLTQALDETAAKNPSPYFRRALWQISNTLKVGADINNTLTSIVTSFSESQVIKATKYGRELNMLSMLYMILTVIFPTLGVTFLIILSSFLGIFVNWFILILILLVTIVVQLFFLSMIRARKPYMVV